MRCARQLRRVIARRSWVKSLVHHRLECGVRWDTGTVVLMTSCIASVRLRHALLRSGTVVKGSGGGKSDSRMQSSEAKAVQSVSWKFSLEGSIRQGRGSSMIVTVLWENGPYRVWGLIVGFCIGE